MLPKWPHQECLDFDLLYVDVLQVCCADGALKRIWSSDAQFLWLARRDVAVQVKLLFKLAAKKAPSIIFLGKQELRINDALMQITELDSLLSADYRQRQRRRKSHVPSHCVKC